MCCIFVSLCIAAKMSALGTQGNLRFILAVNSLQKLHQQIAAQERLARFALIAFKQTVTLAQSMYSYLKITFTLPIKKNRSVAHDAVPYKAT